MCNLLENNEELGLAYCLIIKIIIIQTRAYSEYQGGAHFTIAYPCNTQQIVIIS